MKRFITLLIVLSLALGSTAIVFADEDLLIAPAEEIVETTEEPVEEIEDIDEVTEPAEPTEEVTEEPQYVSDPKVSEEVEPVWFSDVPEDNAYYAVVKDVYEKGLMTGVSEDYFDLETPVTKEMLATVLYRLAGSPEVKEETTCFYNDTVPGAYYMNAVTWVYDNDIMIGLEPHTFGVGKILTIVEVKDLVKNYTAVEDGSFVFGLDRGELLFNRARLAELLSSYAK